MVVGYTVGSVWRSGGVFVSFLLFFSVVYKLFCCYCIATQALHADIQLSMPICSIHLSQLHSSAVAARLNGPFCLASHHRITPSMPDSLSDHDKHHDKSSFQVCISV